MRSNIFTTLVFVATMTQTFGAIIPSSLPTPAGPVSDVEVPSSGLPMLPTPTLPAGGVATPSGVPQAGPDVPASGIPTPPGADAILPITRPSGVPSMDTSSVTESGPIDLTDKPGDIIGDVSKNLPKMPAAPTLPVSAPTLPVSAPTLPSGLPTTNSDGLPISIPDPSSAPALPNADVVPSGTNALPISVPEIQVPSNLPIPEIPIGAVPSGMPSAPVAFPAVPTVPTASAPGQAGGA